MAHDLGRFARFLGIQVQGDIGPMTFYTSDRGKLVGFPRAPPLEPPTDDQEAMRNVFRQAAAEWRDLSTAERTAWLDLATTANLGISGYNLWTWFWYGRREQNLAYLERRTGITVTRPA